MRDLKETEESGARGSDLPEPLAPKASRELGFGIRPGRRNQATAGA